MLRKIIKNKKAQAMLEFCICVPIVLLMTLGVLDVSKATIIKLENTQAMQAYLSLAASDNRHTGSYIKHYAAQYIQDTAMFCTQVQGSGSVPACMSKAVHPVKTQIRLETTGELKAGTQVCMASKSEFKPYYSGVYAKGTMTIYSRTCTMMETHSSNASGWEPIAKGYW